ncbi:MAG: AI-2E family transporter [Roseovarius sp.]
MAGLKSPADPVLRLAVIVIAVLMGFGVLKLAGDIFAPMVLGIVTGVILAPITDLLERWKLPSGVASAIVLALGISGVAVVVVLLEPLVWRVVDELPDIKWEVRSIIEQFRGVIRGLDAMNEEVGQALGTGQNGEDKGNGPIPDPTATLLLAPLVLAQVLIFAGTLFFFLLTRRGIYVWVSTWVGDRRDTVIIKKRFTTAERLVARYFLTISIINAGLGASLGALMMVIGLPGPLIWGVVATMLNFILYVGPIMVIGGLLLAGLIAFDGLMVFAPAAIFLCLNMIESQFVTPAMVGKHISVNPLLIFVSLVIWLWMWGPIGGIVAIPVLVIVLVMLDIFDSEGRARKRPPSPSEPEPPVV